MLFGYCAEMPTRPRKKLTPSARPFSLRSDPRATSAGVSVSLQLAAT